MTGSWIPPRRRTRQPSPDSNIGDDTGSRKEDSSRSASEPDEKHSETESTAQGRSPPDGLASAHAKPADSGESNPDTVKLRKVLALRAEGWTQKQIAEQFGKDVRTVRRWEQVARRQQLVILEKLTPEVVLGDFLFGNAELSWNVRRQLKAAQHAGDTLLVLKCVRELTHLATARLAVLARIGLFEGFTFPALKSGAPGQEGVARLHQAIRNAETDTYEVDEENSGSEESHDQESLY